MGRDQCASIMDSNRICSCMRPSPEEQARLKTEKEAKKAAKKAKFGAINADQNMPVCEVCVPWEWDMGRVRPHPTNPDWIPPATWSEKDGRWWKHVSNEDLETPSWQDYVERCVYDWTIEPCFVDYWPGTDWSKKYNGPYKLKITRT